MPIAQSAHFMFLFLQINQEKKTLSISETNFFFSFFLNAWFSDLLCLKLCKYFDWGLDESVAMVPWVILYFVVLGDLVN